MNSVSDLLRALSALGNVVTLVGSLITRLGFAISPPNLGGEQTELDLDQPISRMRQDPLAQGAEDEKPVRFKPEASLTGRDT
jgi:hypothetical protein